MIAHEKQPITAPVFMERCPVHGQLVAFDGEHRLLGRCAGCMNEAAGAIVLIKRGEA